MSKFCMGCMEQYGDSVRVCPYCGYEEGTKPAQPLHMEPGSILNDRYIIGRALGFGGFGVTYMGWDALLETKVAIKEYLPSEFSTRMPGVTQVTVYSGDKSEQFRDGLRQFVNEAKRLAKLNSIEGIVRIFDSFEENNTAYIVMEYLEGETLAARLEREGTVEPDEAISMLLPVIESLQQVHDHGIVHRDLAPDNLFITTDGTVKVIDFGAARFATTSHSRSLTVIIKPGYSPEEQYRSRKEQGGYTDVYAIGATLYRMITGVVPPDALERYAMAEGKKKEILEPIRKYCKKITENQTNAIMNALNVRIQDRTQTMAALAGELTSETPVVRVYGKIRKTDQLTWPLWAKITAVAAILAVVTFGVLFGTGVIGFEANLQTGIRIPEGMTRVPSVVNDTTLRAEERLAEASLVYTITGKEYSELVPADYVLTQDLEGGVVVLCNSNVNITISGGARMAQIPNVVNLPEGEAVKLLEEGGFVISRIEEYSSVIEPGYVISQSHEAGTEAAVGSVITLVISRGQDPEVVVEEKEIDVPDLVGKSYNEILQIAQELGFRVSVADRRYSNDHEVNEIISQSPEAGDTILTGDTVQVVISLGRQTVRVADVQYKAEADARAVLQDQGLNVNVAYIHSDTVAAGLVITQDPPAGTSVEPGQTVELTVSKGAAGFEMPDVVGMTETEAKAALSAKGLSVSVTYEYSTTSKGTVLRQSIESGTTVTKGTTVTITVSSGEETITVANVVGKEQNEAQSILKNSGFKVTVNTIYSDTVSAGLVISQSPEAGSAQTKGTTIVLTVSLGKDTVQSVSIQSRPGKTSYFVGETLDPAGLTLTAKYRSGKTETVTGGYTCSPTALNTPGEQTVTVTYEGLTATFTVTVKEVTLESVTLKSRPAKTSYYVGDTLDTAGLTLTARYNDGSTEEVTGGFTCSPTTLNTAGTQTVKVTYYGKETSFTVTVSELALERIAVKSLPGKTDYYVGDSLDHSGLTLTATYNNGSTETVVSGFTCSPTTLNTAGTQTITVSYNGKTTTFQVNVENVELTGITLKSRPNKTSYYVGDTLDTTGLTLTGTYSNGTTKEITGGFTCSPTTLNTAGTQTVTVSYGGMSVTFTVTVETPTATRVEVYSLPNKTSYYVGDTLETAGLNLRVTYSNNSTKYVTEGFTCSPTVLNTQGSQTITVTYEGLTASFTVTVSRPGVEKIAIATLPNKTSYSLGDTLNTAGLTLTVTYANGASETVSSGFSCSPTALNTEGTQTITVTYEGKTATFTVTVSGNALASGSCGSNLQWQLTKDGVLTISGSGAMSDFSPDNAPWSGYAGSITSVNISGAATIGTSAFENLTSLSSVSLPSGLTTIGVDAFCNCTSLTSLTIPSSVTTLRDGAFQLSGLRKVTIPSSVTSMGSFLFNGCTSLTGVTMNNSPTALTESMFYGCGALSSITIPSSVQTIGPKAFYNCSSLSSITIPSKVTTIATYAFRGCSGLSTVTVPSGVSSIEGYAFYQCTGLTKITVQNRSCSIDSLSYTMGVAGKTVICGYAGSTAQTYAEANGYEFSPLDPENYTPPATSSSCGDSLTWSYSNGTLTITGSGAMHDYDYDTMPWSAYRYDITSVSLPSGLTRIGNSAFNSCENLSRVTIPSGVTSIGNYAFVQCSALSSVTIPNGVTSIGKNAFANIGITSISIPGSVTGIADGAFQSNSYLTSVSLPGSISTINMGTFFYCTSLRTITIPSSVTAISSQAFEGCSSLTDIYIMNSGCSIHGNKSTLGVAGTTTVHGYSGSTAQSYAESYGFAFVAME